jgi:hypothetical protein
MSSWGSITEVGSRKKKTSTKNSRFVETFTSVNPVWLGLVTLRGPSAKHFWDGLEQFGARLEELLGVGGDKHA